MDSNSPILEACDIRRRAEDGSVLLDAVSLQIPPASVTVITGPPGSGKTLLLRALGLLDPLEGGEVRYRGAAVIDHDVPAVRRQVILVPQRAVLVEGSVRDNLRMPFGFHQHTGREYDETRIIRLLDRLGRQASFLERSTSDLSGGESQIVALLRGLQLDPTVLLLDEPTSSLDEETAAGIERLTSDWSSAEEERALVLVTHNPRQAGRMARRTVFMESGSIVDVVEDAIEPA